MNRLIFVPYIAAFGGVERLILSLTRYLAAHGQTSTILCFDDTVDLGQQAQPGVTVSCLHPKRHNWAEASALAGFFRSTAFDAANRPLFFDLKSAFYAGLSGIQGHVLHLTDPPSLLTVESSRHGSAYRKWSRATANSSITQRVKGEIVHYLNRRGAKNASDVIVMTQRIAAELKALYGINTQLVRPGVSPQPQRHWVSRPADLQPFKLFSVSRLESSKRLDDVLVALHQLTEKTSPPGQSWEFNIAGAGPAEPGLKDLTRQLGLERNVRFHGRVTDDQLETLYSEADVFVMPAVQGYGLPALEALMRRVPVVLHRDSGVSEILELTPWAAVIAQPTDLVDALIMMRQRVEHGILKDASLPPLPTDDSWAAQIAKACDWAV